MRVALATVAIAALVAASPAASGMTATTPWRPTVVVKVPRGFDWAAALIGAGAAAGVLVAIAGALQALRHERKEDL
jgi:hypothetical protein